MNLHPISLRRSILNFKGIDVNIKNKNMATSVDCFNLNCLPWQRIQSAVLSRSGSKNHMENVDEEAEARLLQEMNQERIADDDIVVIENRRDGGTITHHSPTGSSASKERSVQHYSLCFWSSLHTESGTFPLRPSPFGNMCHGCPLNSLPFSAAAPFLTPPPQKKNHQERIYGLQSNFSCTIEFISTLEKSQYIRSSSVK